MDWRKATAVSIVISLAAASSASAATLIKGKKQIAMLRQVILDHGQSCPKIDAAWRFKPGAFKVACSNGQEYGVILAENGETGAYPWQWMEDRMPGWEYH